MQAKIQIIDWELGFHQRPQPELRLVSETLTLGELIAQRINAACEARLAELQPSPDLAPWAVVPGRQERALNGDGRIFGPGHEKLAPPSSEAEIKIARKAFEDQRFVVMFDGSQIGAWDERITVREDSTATFIKLTPLKGG
jgi:hypothetical protein